MKTEDQQTYNKQYYDTNKKRIIKQVVERQKLIRNSDKYIEDHRDKLINDLNNGTRKFVQYKTLLKYKVNVDPKSLKYYYNSEARTPSEPTTEEEEEHPQQQQGRDLYQKERDLYQKEQELEQLRQEREQIRQEREQHIRVREQLRQERENLLLDQEQLIREQQ